MQKYRLSGLIHLQTVCRTCGVNRSPRRICDAPRDDEEMHGCQYLHGTAAGYALAVSNLYYYKIEFASLR